MITLLHQLATTPPTPAKDNNHMGSIRSYHNNGFISVLSIDHLNEDAVLKPFKFHLYVWLLSSDHKWVAPN